MEPLPDNLIVTSFNYSTSGTYSLISRLSRHIHHTISIGAYFQEDKLQAKFALFYSRLEYFNTDVFLIKNFYLKEENKKHTLFGDVFYEIEYLIKLKSPKMYILLIYSDEIKNIKDVEKFIKADKLDIKLSPITAKKTIIRLHNSIQSIITI